MMQSQPKSPEQVQVIVQAKTPGYVWWLPVVTLLVIVAYFGIQTHGSLFDWAAVSEIIDQSIGLGTIALGAALVLLLGEIDLSLAVVAYLCGGIVAVLSARSGVAGVPVIVVTLLVGAALGVVNGVLVAIVGLPSAFATLVGATLEVLYSGVLLAIMAPQTTVQIRDPVLLGLESNYIINVFTDNPRFPGDGLYVPESALIFVVLFVCCWFLLRFTRFGRGIYAIGRDVQASRRASVSAVGIRIAVFVLASTFAAIGGILQVSRFNAALSIFDPTQLLFAAAAPVIGGVSLFGGRGSVWAVPVGALICGCILAGPLLTGQDPGIAHIVEAVALIVAITIPVAGDVLTRRRNASNAQ